MRHLQVLNQAVTVVQSCQRGAPIKQLWDHAPYVQAQQQAQHQQQRAVGKVTEVGAPSPLKQQMVPQQFDDVKGLQDVEGQ
jgi:hypothetical protein